MRRQIQVILSALTISFLVTGCSNSSGDAVPIASANPNPQSTPIQRNDTNAKKNPSPELKPTPSANGIYKVDAVCNTDPRVRIERIKITDDKTIIYFSYTNDGSYNYPITTAPPGHEEAFFIMKPNKSKRFELLDIEGIAIKPSYTQVKPKETVKFALTFERIEDSMSHFHVIEGAVEPADGNLSWRFLNVAIR